MNITELVQSLKAAAEKATPGGWCIDDYHGVIADAGLNGNYYIASTSGPDHRSNKLFIALANPANVLALVEALEKAQQRISRLESRSVKPPKAMSIEGGAYCSAHAHYDSDGDYYDRTDVEEMLSAAGIKVEAE